MNIKKFIFKTLNISIVKRFPRHSIRFAKRIFKDKLITAIEIGTFFGYNAESILKELNIKKIYLVDPYEQYEGYKESEDGKSQSTLSKAEKFAKNKLNDHKNKLIWIKEYSNNAIKNLPKEVDFIYIDGNHNYKFVKEDMENYFKILKRGGVLGGHDITGGFGVEQAFVEFCYENKLKPYISRTDWWVVKN